MIFRAGVSPATFVPEISAVADEDELRQVVAGYRREQRGSASEISVAGLPSSDNPPGKVAEVAKDWDITEARQVAQEWKRDVREGRKPITSAYEPEIFDAFCIVAEHDDALPSTLKMVLDEVSRLPDCKEEVNALQRQIQARLGLKLESLAGRIPRSVTWAWRKRIPNKASTLAVGEPGRKVHILG